MNEKNKKEIREYKKIILEPITAQLIEEVENDKDYKQNEKFDVSFFSVYCDMFDDYDFKEKIELFGAHYFLFLQFLKAKMLGFGKYYIYEKHMERLIKEYCFSFSSDIENIKSIYQDLVNSKYISVIQCSCFDSAIVVEPIIFHNYRLVQEKRVYNRNYKKSQRANKKAEENTQIEETEEAPSEPLSEVKAVQDNTIFNDEFGFGKAVTNEDFF